MTVGAEEDVLSSQVMPENPLSDEAPTVEQENEALRRERGTQGRKRRAEAQGGVDSAKIENKQVTGLYLARIARVQEAVKLARSVVPELVDGVELGHLAALHHDHLVR